ncbi:UNVERIFIED_CONTAM: hypothetical protein Slati_1507500 [Sesamum latifolium]|uniref:Gag-pol polyprotein n=1 Tax=Sesamum latifolium TaxID=2727402 RepID=A0AAW2X7B2_9LAMI
MEPSDHKDIQLIEDNPTKVTKVGTTMTMQAEDEMILFLRSNVDVLAWSPSDFQGINPDVIVHSLNVDSDSRPIKQKKRNFRNERNQIIEQEISKLLAAGCVMEVQYTDWLPNVAIIPKGGEKWRMSTNFTDLKKNACPKDLFPLPRMDRLVDSTAGCALLSMMDAF